MGWLDLACHRCGIKYPNEVETQEGMPPAEGFVKDIQKGMFSSTICCWRCWKISGAIGDDLADQDVVKRWKDKDWSDVQAEAKREEAEIKAGLQAKQTEAEEAAQAEFMAIRVSTGDVRWPYEIERVVFNIGASTGMLGFIPPSPDQALRAAELALKHQAYELGCHAVVHTQFEHRITVTEGVFGNNQGVEVFAYGTAVRRIDSTD